MFAAAPEGARKCILSTNIAETSVTIDGVRFVADSGRAKEMLHDAASGGGALQEGWISRASADQRKGRAGRTGPGKCYRLYSEAAFRELRPFSLPEIQRTRLEAVMLDIKALAGSGMDPRRFGFLDPPPPETLEAAILNLQRARSPSHRSSSLERAHTRTPPDLSAAATSWRSPAHPCSLPPPPPRRRRRAR